MKLFSIVILCLIIPINSWACYEAELYKIYPICESEGNILAIDMHIQRNNAGFYNKNERIEGNLINENSHDIEEFANYDLEWIIRTYITRYDKFQNKIESIPLDSARFYTEKEGKIIDKLKLLYERGINHIISNNKNIELFTPVGISFGEHSQNCKNLISKDNSFIKEDDLAHIILTLKDRPEKLFPHIEESQKFQLLKAFNSISKYICSTFELININIQVGQTFGDEEIPQISLVKDIKFAIYEEPIIYHGNGYDVFFIK